MRTLARLAALAPAERRLALAAALLVAGARLALVLLPYRTVRRLAARLARPRARPPLPASRVAWAVAAAGRRVPGGANCLAQALAAHVLLRRHGHPSRVRLGVARTPRRGLEAHAWVELEGAALVGGNAAARYAPFPLAAEDLA
jgi:hypothetical protein